MSDVASSANSGSPDRPISKMRLRMSGVTAETVFEKKDMALDATIRLSDMRMVWNRVISSVVAGNFRAVLALLGR